MNRPMELGNIGQWTDYTRVPYFVYHDEEIYQRELERIFYGPFWHPVALEAELPNVGDYKTVTVGETRLLVIRNSATEVSCMVNACAHRGVQIVTNFRGTAGDFTCPYHAWSYDTKGNLMRVPGEERFPAGFEKRNYGLRRLPLASYGQVLWTTFDPDGAGPIEKFLGETSGSFMASMGGGDRKLQLLGYQKIVFNCNWKVYMDNDGYHAGILHTAFRLLDYGGGKATIVADGTGGSWGAHYGSKKVEDNGYLRDPSVVTVMGDDNIAAVNLIRPVTQAVKHLNTINFRFGRPLGPDKTEVHYCYLAYADDKPDLVRHKIRQAANLLGPSGFVSIEDGSMFERVQKSVRGQGGEINFLKGLEENPDGHYSLQNDEAGNTPWWRDYRDRMGL